MLRIPLAAVAFLVSMSVFASDRPNGERSKVIATTGRIIKINTRDKTLTVSGPASAEGLEYAAQTAVVAFWNSSTGILIPGGLPIPSQSKSSANLENRYEYTILTTTNTVFQDGAEDIRFEDFKSGETVWIDGALKGTTLTAARLAKWN